MDRIASESMNSPLLVKLFKQAIKTFTPNASPKSEFFHNFKNLKNLIDQVRAEDVRLDPAFNDISLWENKEKAPCTYIEIFQNDHLNMSIFILKPDFTMPLHDHPQMHGLLKVISGEVRVKCFTKVQNENNYTINSDDSKTFLAEASEYKYCNANSESCILTPDDSNFHEIRSIGGPSAFLDILAPPYSTYIQDVGERQCRYYQVSNEINANLVQMQEIPLPRWFYCDQAQYLGPVLI